MARTPLVVAPLVVLVVLAGALGARLLLADPDAADASAASATCWDGSTSRDGVAGCSSPRGLEGLAWVFPSVDLDDPACEGVERGRVASWTCRTRVEGLPVVIEYAAARDVGTILRDVRATYRGGNRAVSRGPDGNVNREVWRLATPDRSGSMVVTSVYRRHPYSVTVSAPTVRARDRALKLVVEHRDASEVRGVVAGR